MKHFKPQVNKIYLTYNKIKEHNINTQKMYFTSYFHIAENYKVVMKYKNKNSRQTLKSFILAVI